LAGKLLLRKISPSGRTARMSAVQWTILSQQTQKDRKWLGDNTQRKIQIERGRKRKVGETFTFLKENWTKVVQIKTTFCSLALGILTPHMTLMFYVLRKKNGANVVTKRGFLIISIVISIPISTLLKCIYL
jgi:hypothetical protein